jgi:hypothetical protein
MTIFSAETATIRKACEVALELIENVSAIPLEYFRAISSPMVRVNPMTEAMFVN